MMFLLHLPPETRALDRSPLLSKLTCEFLVQVVFECSCPAVLRACGLMRQTPREEFNRSFGAPEMSRAALERIAATTQYVDRRDEK